MAEELSDLRDREVKLQELIKHAEGIFGEVNPEWDPEKVQVLKPRAYSLPFEIGTATRVALTIMRETGDQFTSRTLAKMVLAREGIEDCDWKVVDRVASAIDRSMRDKKGKYVKGEGSWPIYWSILHPDDEPSAA